MIRYINSFGGQQNKLSVMGNAYSYISMQRGRHPQGKCSGWGGEKGERFGAGDGVKGVSPTGFRVDYQTIEPAIDFRWA